MQLSAFLSPGCPRRVCLKRGLCPAHYRQTARSVAEGVTSWADLKLGGRCLPARPSPWREGRKWLRLRPGAGGPVFPPRGTR
jgi:hypothetical protein